MYYARDEGEAFRVPCNWQPHEMASSSYAFSTKLRHMHSRTANTEANSAQLKNALFLVFGT